MFPYYGLFKTWVDGFQSEHQCCGWFNVFDYCEVPEFAHIAYSSIKDHELTATLNEIQDTLCLMDESYWQDFKYLQKIQKNVTENIKDFIFEPSRNFKLRGIF